MLGHKAYQVISRYYKTFVTFRNYDDKLRETNIFNKSQIIDAVNAFDLENIKKIIQTMKPKYILNCIGIIKQKETIKNAKLAIFINSLFPHLIADICSKMGSKLIHISTDCVFSGKTGNYTEKDVSDAEDFYGKSKYLGEVGYRGHLTIRTSIIGRELFTNYSLVNWLVSNKNKEVPGYKNAIYTGLTTIALSKEIVRIINKFPHLHGLYHVSSERISKFDLLVLINKIFKLKVNILPNYDYFCDRSLTFTKYQKQTNYRPYSWKSMIYEMYADKTNYGRRENS